MLYSFHHQNLRYPSVSAENPAVNSRRNDPALNEEIESIRRQAEDLKNHSDWKRVQKVLSSQIEQWGKESIEQIRLAASNAKRDIRQRRKELSSSYDYLILQLSSQNISKESDVEQLKRLLEKCQCMSQEMFTIEINVGNLPCSLIKFQNKRETGETTSDSSIGKQHAKNAQESSIPPTTMEISPRDPSVYFGITETSDQKIQALFDHLQSLLPMDKYGPMSGNCDRETTQMEQFLEQTFHFKNVTGQYIVQGVKKFTLGRPLQSMSSNEVIRFPSTTSPHANSFAMSVEEIHQWQNSYAVYADQNKTNITKDFLQYALRGKSKNGPEGFLMKFVVRISQCPILMEFDGKVIPRDINQSWPNNIRLVSVTGIDFAGRIHDVDDIRTYIRNWRDIFEVNPETNLPHLYRGRDFYFKHNASRAQLDEARLADDLKRMARLRLRACDREKVEIVVETGIGLGVFAGKYIGIDETVRRHSARAIREVLEEDGHEYQHICAVVFTLPIFDGDVRNGRREDTYHAFESVFGQTNYNGPIPVLLADQDMHRLTVAIAKMGFRVSELNPADSHGVFGEYWQNRGPAVEEKLALTTVGLLVQHHLINPYVLDPSHYHLI